MTDLSEMNFQFSKIIDLFSGEILSPTIQGVKESASRASTLIASGAGTAASSASAAATSVVGGAKPVAASSSAAAASSGKTFPD
jgi:hypothetical protein